MQITAALPQSKMTMARVSPLLVLLLPLVLLVSTGCCETVVDSVAEAVELWQIKGNPSILKFPANNKRGYSLALITVFTEFCFRKDDVKFHLFTTDDDSNVEGTVVTADSSSLLAAGWNSTAPVRIVIHGFGDDINSEAIQEIKNAYLATGEYNVILVDWGKLCSFPWYVSSVHNVAPTGKVVGELINVLIETGLSDRSRIHVIGHSLGAHVAGLAGKAVTNGSIYRITGLDPALPLFEWTKHRLSQDDADTVDVIHTSAGSLGFAAALGTVDFYPNGGKNQPGCNLDLFDTCSHARSHEYFTESILNSTAYPSEYCSSASNAEKGDCSANGGFAVMGDKLRFSNEGSYYLTTEGQAPYAED